MWFATYRRYTPLIDLLLYTHTRARAYTLPYEYIRIYIYNIICTYNIHIYAIQSNRNNSTSRERKITVKIISILPYNVRAYNTRHTGDTYIIIIYVGFCFSYIYFPSECEHTQIEIFVIFLVPGGYRCNIITRARSTIFFLS